MEELEDAPRAAHDHVMATDEAAMKHAGEHGIRVLVRPCPHPCQEPDTGKEDAS